MVLPAPYTVTLSQIKWLWKLCIDGLDCHAQYITFHLAPMECHLERNLDKRRVLPLTNIFFAVSYFLSWQRKSIQTSFKVDKNGFWIVLKGKHQPIGLLFKWHSKILNVFWIGFKVWFCHELTIQKEFKIYSKSLWMIFE